MITLIMYFRRVFCNHILEFEEMDIKIYNEYGRYLHNRTKVYMRCDRCGFHQKHWKD